MGKKGVVDIEKEQVKCETKHLQLKEIEYTERIDDDNKKEIIEKLAKIADKTLDETSMKETFGWSASMASINEAYPLLKKGIIDIEKISAAIHIGWSDVAKSYKDPEYAKNPGKKERRLKLASNRYENLSENEKEKDRIIARAILATWNDMKSTKKWSFVSRKNTAGIVAVIAQKGYKFLFVEQKRVTVNKYVISFPSGLMDPGETPEKTARREIKEETGYEIDKIISTSPFLPKSSGMTDESVYIVQCTVKEEHGDPTDPKEGTRPFWMSANKFIEHVNNLDKDKYAVEGIAWSYITGYAR